MKYIYLLASIVALTACEQELAETAATSGGDLLIKVGDFPVFSETAETRAVGTPDEGKTAWANGDKLLLHLSYTNDNGEQDVYSTLTYNGTAWTASPALTLSGHAHSASLTAYYAPAYAWDGSGNLTGTAGTAEFLQTTQTLTSRQVSIDFSATRRTYSRLRFVSSPNTQLTVTLTGFTPAGNNTSAADYNGTLTTDSKGNAYLYGSWGADVRLMVQADYLTSNIEKTLSTSVAAQSYAVDTPVLIPTIPDSWKNSTTDIRGYYKLTADITLNGNWTPIGNASTSSDVGQFLGTFDGNGYTITGLAYNSNTVDNFGLFRTIGQGGIVRNLNISDCDITSSGTIVGGIAGINYGTIENCHIVGNSTVNGNGYYIGSIAGLNEGGGRIIACSNAATVKGSSNSETGGICGTINRSNVIACYNTGNITGSSDAGGIVERVNNGASVTSCYYTQGGDNGYGTYVTAWTQDVVDDMNSALQNAGYPYRYVLEGGVPKIEGAD